MGAENHCAHGLGTITETILDWEPYKNFTVQSRQESISFSMLQTFKLQPFSDEKRTRLTIHTEVREAGPVKIARALLIKGMEGLWKMDYQRLIQMIAAEEMQFHNQVVSP